MSLARRTLIISAAAATLLLPVLGGEGRAQQGRTLTIAQGFDPQTLWPNGTTASDNLNAGNAIVEALLWNNPATQKIEPMLVESWEPLTSSSMRLHLRKGVTFTNGEPMNADAVVHSFKVFLDPKQTPAYANYAAAIDRVEKIDDATVVVHTKFPYPPFELMLTQVYVTPPAYWASVGLDGFGQKPIGTGPFKLTEWVKDNRVVMDRNPNYWGKGPTGIDRVVWRPVPDDTARVAGFTTGEFDVATNIPIAAIDEINAQPDRRVIETPSYRIFQLILSSLEEHPSPLKDKRVRQAVNYAIDKTAIIKNLFAGRAFALNGQLLRKEQLGYDPGLKDYPYDPAKAKALLAEAGFPNGLEITFKFPSGRYAQDREVSEAIAGMLAKAGIRTKMVSLEPGEFLRQLRNRELQPMAYLGLAPLDDPDFQMAQYRSTWRYAYVRNADLDALIDAGARETDKAKRAEIYQKISRLMYEEVPVAFLFGGYDFYGVSKALDGFVPRGDQRFFLHNVTLKR
ncbi:ABC transporter substrate-binding protein [Alsobacter sp. SYSU M60028]|uniref:ABC transporter substrate-binding protein n=1 Tax=Alsobacter ponti TaxID=2962936 RepID=A0ABT1LHS3_9HYPH|nr:ABC transporter substrate-binding protein [Alsobacter ponti]MCP8941055.1 ABC transporter substrate-binding protein [Alsobacter ponti]